MIRFAFRRAMQPHLIDTGDVDENSGARGRSAKIFRRRRGRS